jgi:hypothetical protein
VSLRSYLNNLLLILPVSQALLWVGEYFTPHSQILSLIVAHAYAVLKAVEFHGRKFMKIRNLWGESEWTGRWSDGSKEWQGKWLGALKALDHSFVNDVGNDNFLGASTYIRKCRAFYRGVLRFSPTF